MAIAAVLLILLLAAPAAYGVQHVVGGNSGWTQSVDYTTWANSQVFTVGDTLVFNYDSSSHKVSEVSESEYSACSSANANKTYDDGSTTITLSKAGPRYFICPTIGHCAGGMKLAVNVVAASTTPGTPPTTPGSSPAPSSGGAAPGTPSTTPGSTASPPPPHSNSNGAATIFCELKNLILGSLLVLGTTVALMG